MQTREGIFKDFVHKRQVFTGQGVGDVLNLGSLPKKDFTLQVLPNANTPATWNVTVMGSMDGVNFTALVNHKSGTNVINSIVMSNGGPITFLRVDNVGASADPVIAELLGV